MTGLAASGIPLALCRASHAHRYGLAEAKRWRPTQTRSTVSRNMGARRLHTTKEKEDDPYLHRLLGLVEGGGSDRARPRGAGVCPAAPHADHPPYNPPRGSRSKGSGQNDVHAVLGVS